MKEEIKIQVGERYLCYGFSNLVRGLGTDGRLEEVEVLEISPSKNCVRTEIGWSEIGKLIPLERLENKQNN